MVCPGTWAMRCTKEAREAWAMRCGAGVDTLTQLPCYAAIEREGCVGSNCLSLERVWGQQGVTAAGRCMDRK